MCKFCGKILENEKSIKSHELREHGNTEYGNISCEVCGIAFIGKHKLKVHILSVHGNERPFICDVCPKSFKRKLHLEAHKLIHTGEKKYACTRKECEMAFSKKTTLVQHERLHTGEKPYKCNDCNIAFVQRNSLNVHNNTHHKKL